MVGPSNAEASGGPSSKVLPQERQMSPTSSGNGTKKLSNMLVDPDSLHCPICYQVLSIPVFQCDNGHIACFVCCPKLSNKCPLCALPIGFIRCRAMETILESVFVPCRNAKSGCTKNASYGNNLTHHEKECEFSICSCPIQDCSYTALTEDLFTHCVVTHRPSMLFNFFDSISATLNIVRAKTLVLTDYQKHIIFVAQCFKEPCGVYVTVSCIAPSASEIGEFSYHLSYVFDGHKMTYESPKMKMVLQVSSQTPQENFMLIPQSYLRGDEFNIQICIRAGVEARVTRLV